MLKGLLKVFTFPHVRQATAIEESRQKLLDTLENPPVFETQGDVLQTLHDLGSGNDAIAKWARETEVVVRGERSF